jgi:hypothetical protein
MTLVERQRESWNKSNQLRREGKSKPRGKNKDAPNGTKWCPGCIQYLALAQFHKGGNGSYCRDCYSNSYHSSRLMRVYGITAEQYYEILDHQGGGCAICDRVLRSKKYSVDHNHKTGEVRGLLCNPCNNRILGSAKDDPSILRRAADYLEKPPAREVIGVHTVPDRTGS